MSRKRELLEESRDFWQEEANYDKRNFLASFTITAAGLTLAGVGIGTLSKGDVTGGLAEVIFGGGVAIASAKLALGEVIDFADMSAKTAVIQSQIDQLPKQ